MTSAHVFFIYFTCEDKLLYWSEKKKTVIDKPKTIRIKSKQQNSKRKGRTSEPYLSQLLLEWETWVDWTKMLHHTNIKPDDLRVPTPVFNTFLSDDIGKRYNCQPISLQTNKYQVIKVHGVSVWGRRLGMRYTIFSFFETNRKFIMLLKT